MKHQTSAMFSDRYADTIIGNAPENYDAIEVHGVRNINPPESEDTHYEVDDDDPQSYAVYLHLVSGGIDCGGDFSTHDAAMEYASQLGRQYGWEVSNYTTV